MSTDREFISMIVLLLLALAAGVSIALLLLSARRVESLPIIQTTPYADLDGPAALPDGERVTIDGARYVIVPVDPWVLVGDGEELGTGDNGQFQYWFGSYCSDHQFRAIPVRDGWGVA